MAYIATWNGNRKQIKTPVSMDDARRIVGGDVEVVHPKASPGVVFLCNEDGLYEGMPVNEHGCFLYGTEDHGHPVVGDIIVFEKGDNLKGWVDLEKI